MHKMQLKKEGYSVTFKENIKTLTMLDGTTEVFKSGPPEIIVEGNIEHAVVKVVMNYVSLFSRKPKHIYVGHAEVDLMQQSKEFSIQWHTYEKQFMGLVVHTVDEMTHLSVSE